MLYFGQSRITIITFIVQIHKMKAVDIILIFILWLIGLSYLNPSQPNLQETVRDINQRTLKTIQNLIQTKFFRIIRLNINQPCPLGIMNRICKSKSCTLCRCNRQDIPQTWESTEKVVSHVSGQDIWQHQRQINDSEWFWHVEDEKNDEGQYFDLHKNIESFTNYNGSFIWKIIYEQNCFPHKQEDVCTEEQVFYQIISGLHASISTHLCKFYKYSHQQNKWADLKPTNKTDESIYTFNSSQYQSRLLQHPQRIRNLFFVYRLLAKAIVKASPYLLSNFSLTSDDISQDVLAKNYLIQLYESLKGDDLLLQEKESLKFFKYGNPMVKQYQKYIHNISDILNCVECQKCRLFFKMQTYGIGTALKILLGYPTPYKRNEIVALFNVFSKMSVSVETYFSQKQRLSFQNGHSMMWLYCWMGIVSVSLYVNKKYNLFCK